MLSQTMKIQDTADWYTVFLNKPKQFAGDKQPYIVIHNWNLTMCALLPMLCPSYFVTDRNLIRFKPNILGMKPNSFSCFTGLFLKL